MKAAGQGYAEAQWEIGGLYHNGRDVDQSFTAAARWFRKAANQGIAGAQSDKKAEYWRRKGYLSYSRGGALCKVYKFYILVP